MIDIIQLILGVLFLICGLLDIFLKIGAGKKFHEWGWTALAMMWCANATFFRY